VQTKIVIRELQVADLFPAAEVLGKAFATNPNSIAVNRGKSVSPQQLKYAFVGRFKYLPGQKYVSELDGNIVGAMRIVEWPACQASLLQTLRMMPYALRASGGLGNFSRGLKILNTWKRLEPRRPHFHLEPLGIALELQGKGVGSQMMDFYCRIIDKEGKEAYHETDRPENVPFYEKFGFKVVGEITIIGAKNWFMLRNARSRLT
jgi:GNAT superfamily N-acetyltransferase